MAEGISCSSSPLEDKRMLWDHMALPLEIPLTVRRGDRIDVKIRVNMVKKQPVAQWDVSVSGVELHQSGFRGMLISKSDLEISLAETKRQVSSVSDQKPQEL
jgi:hypothetical protein